MKRDFWFSLDGRSFEKEIGKLYRRLGYHVKLRGGHLLPVARSAVQGLLALMEKL